MADAPDPPLLGRRVALLPRYARGGPSSRLRLLQYVPWLEAAGAIVEVRPFFGDRYLSRWFADGRKDGAAVLAAHARRLAALPALARADVAWVEKEIFPFLPGTAERALAALRVPYAVDYDDATFHTYDLNRSALVRRLLGRRLRPLLRGAALVTAGNRYLADHARRHGAARVELIPTVVDTARYPVLPPPADGELRVGWIGTPANARYLAPAIEALAALARERPVRLVTVGAGADALPGPPVPQERHPWSEETEAALLAGIDVGIMPLPDAPWERGKCAYKLIQYMAAGRPVVASPVGANREVVVPDVGLLATGPAEWLAALRRLGGDADARRRMGTAARARVEAHYSLASAAPRVVAWLAGIARR